VVDGCAKQIFVWRADCRFSFESKRQSPPMPAPIGPAKTADIRLFARRSATLANMTDPDAVLALQRQFNEKTRESWASYESHRRRVTDLLLAARPQAPSRLCVLGAGNCNDLELSKLAQAYDEVRLVDLDAAAVRAGVAAQAPEPAEHIAISAPFDVTGVAARMGEWTPAAPAAEASALECLRQISEPSDVSPLRPGFDVVVSTCLLTQLIGSARQTLGDSHPRFMDLVLAMRKQHWRLMARLARPGGVILLVTDFVSSDTAPELAADPTERLDKLAMRLIDARNFFTGANPVALRQELLVDPDLAPLASRVELLSPWLWRLAHRTYLVSAIRARRRE
jgi:hypothetical protein